MMSLKADLKEAFQVPEQLNKNKQTTSATWVLQPVVGHI